MRWRLCPSRDAELRVSGGTWLSTSLHFFVTGELFGAQAGFCTSVSLRSTTSELKPALFVGSFAWSGGVVFTALSPEADHSITGALL